MCAQQLSYGLVPLAQTIHPRQVDERHPRRSLQSGPPASRGKQRDTGRAYVISGTALMATGVVALIASTLLFTIFESKEAMSQTARTHLSISTMVSVDGGGLMFSGRF